ncbi:histidine utilization repressor [Oceanibacterium hippocampi]|uniref:Histidine utilization repressor n=1 Tax=Oceanibacterium hippocampi TaxID=745714 RepID=A0A1Y5U3Q8_9PROT|nr:histidine utilization repressor [Oceanibacterium hippocampi]SLN77686.1 HTH-type transcriptional repressor YvoA [Oceanibacterium hippocampi]
MTIRIPHYQRIKNTIRGRIDRGDWPVDHRIPSEHELMRALGVSRMTVNRALRELTGEGVLRRVQGLGTFVADSRPQAALLEIRNIADEIRGRGRDYSARLIMSASETASAEIAADLDLTEGDVVYRTLVVHCADGTPVQIEDRVVNPAIAPDYLGCDFTVTTPHEYLMRVAPPVAVEHVVDAVLPDAETRDLLGIGAAEPCLLLHRWTWCEGQAATRTWLTHPASRYRLGATFRLGPPAADEASATRHVGRD